MSVRFSVVYPTRHRPQFIRQALRMLEAQDHDAFEVIVSDNWADPAQSCEGVSTGSRLPALRYVRPPRPIGMVENWRHALGAASGEYVAFLTDKMFVLPGALNQVDQALRLAGDPDVVSWTSDSYTPSRYPDYFGEGHYGVASAPSPVPFRPFDPRQELAHRVAAPVSRQEQTAADYARGKLVFGAYRRDLVDRILARFGDLFHNINPDYTSMVLGLSAAQSAIELPFSCVVSVNTDVSNGMLCDTDDAAALRFLESLEGGAAGILPSMLVPGLYVSLHNWVAHDYLDLAQTFGLDLTLNAVNWLVYCHEDVNRPGRRWSSPRVEAEQKELIRAAIAAGGREQAAAIAARLATRPAMPRPAWPRRMLRQVVPSPARRWRLRRLGALSPSLDHAVRQTAGVRT